MFVPEYTITSEILENIAVIEYGKALIENTVILKHWEEQLKKEALVRTVKNSLDLDGHIFDEEKIKRVADKIAKKTPLPAVNFIEAVHRVYEISQTGELDETSHKNFHGILTNNLRVAVQGKYRSKKQPKGANPDEILASVVALFDWYASYDSKQAHPVITAGILHGQLQKIQPFDTFNFSTTTLISKTSLKIANYSCKGYLGPEKLLNNSRRDHQKSIDEIQDDDFTKFLEYYTNITASEVSNIKEKVKLLARNTKLAKASGRVKLTKRQERIIMYLQDYGILKNADFNRIFPDISEDSVLRDLRSLIKKGLVEKHGSTKSSRYELS